MPTMPTHLSILRRRFEVLGFIWFVVALIVNPAHAWNNLGHKTVAEIAWQQLDPSARLTIVDSLRRHPHFDRDFASKLSDEAMEGDKAEQDHWIFLQAATWPDIIRKSEDDRPSWHYVDFPIFLNPSDESALASKLKFNRSSEYPTKIARKDMNVMQAVQHAQAAIRADNAGPDVKAIAYCWLFHLVGDLHQPLHSTALCSVEQFPEGDRGGNEILLTRGNNLHSLWDGFLGNGTKMNDVKRAVYELSDRKLYNEVWYSAGKETDIRKWVDESHALCKSFVYSPAILKAVKGTPAGAKMAPVELSEVYMQRAGVLARERVVAAGMRLGVMLGANSSAFPKMFGEEKRTSTTGVSTLAPSNPTPAKPTRPTISATMLDHWLNTESNTRHNKKCRFYGKTENGRACTADEGRPCKICGG